MTRGQWGVCDPELRYEAVSAHHIKEPIWPERLCKHHDDLHNTKQHVGRVCSALPAIVGACSQTHMDHTTPSFVQGKPNTLCKLAVRHIEQPLTFFKADTLLHAGWQQLQGGEGQLHISHSHRIDDCIAHFSACIACLQGHMVKLHKHRAECSYTHRYSPLLHMRMHACTDTHTDNFRRIRCNSNKYLDGIGHFYTLDGLLL